MYQSAQRLPHVLPPSAYFDEHWFGRERQLFVHEGWHLIGTTEELSQPGDFVTRELFGTPICVRNFDGELKAVSNVCAHRHCVIEGRTRGNSATMKCQYHGWEYGADGCTRKIPSPKNFAPFKQGAPSVPVYRVETAGQLVFVALDAGVSTLSESLGGFRETLAQRFGEGWNRTLSWEVDVPVNWKVVVENSLEAYHVPSVHPETFRDDPGELKSTHEIGERHTSFHTSLPFSPHSKLDRAFQRLEGRFVKWLGREPTGCYEQHHAFPNLLCSFTDTLSLCQMVIPTGPTSCRCIVRQFGITPRAGMLKRVAARQCVRVAARQCVRVAARQWGRLAAWLTKRVLLEDLAMFPQIQKGLECSTQAGMLGRCEERIHAFQQTLSEQLAARCDQSSVRLAKGA